MKKVIVVMFIMVALIASVFATDLDYLRNFEVKEGDEICTIININDAEEISFRMYLNEDKSNPEDYCNRIYRITKGGRFEDSTFEVVRAAFGGMDLTDYMDGHEFTGSDLIESIEIDLVVFKNLVPEVKIDETGSYYYGYDVKINDVYNFVEEVVDYIDQEEQEEVYWY